MLHPDAKPISVRVLEEGIITVRCRGSLDGRDTGYLPDLASAMAQQPGRACLIFDTLEVEHFTPAFALNHLEFLRAHRYGIRRIAVVYTLRSVPMSILAVSVSTGLEIQGFPSCLEAMPWLKSRGPRG